MSGQAPLNPLQISEKTAQEEKCPVFWQRLRDPGEAGAPSYGVNSESARRAVREEPRIAFGTCSVTHIFTGAKQIYP